MKYIRLTSNFILQVKDRSLSSTAEKARYELLMALDDDVEISGDADIEVGKYLNIHVDKKVDPLIWWRTNAKNYPRLAILARIFQSIPASSASAECGFSCAKGNVSANSSSLEPAKLNKKCFIKENYDLLQERLGDKFGLNQKV
jgi:hypothetical protein